MLTSNESDTLEIELPSCVNIGTALKELDVLNTTTNKINQTSRQVLQELHRRPNTIRFNSNYVSNVSFRVRPLHQQQIRYKPYTINIERHRTKSENNDDADNEQISIKEAFNNKLQLNLQMPSTSSSSSSDNNDLIQLKKAKSLESIVIIENNCLLKTSTIASSSSSSSSSHMDNKDLIELQQVEVVSNSIQNLKVDE